MRKMDIMNEIGGENMNNEMIAYAVKIVDNCFNTKWDFTDLFYAYCASKGIDDPEEDLTDEEYDKLEYDCAKQITDGKLRGLREVIIEDINERLRTIWE